MQESHKSKRVIGKYFLTKTLGNGSMGKVKLAINTETKEKVAVKIVPRKTNTHDKKERDAEKIREIRTIKEASMMLLLDNPYIAKVHEMVLVNDFYYLFMEYVDGGQLLDYIISHGKLKERQARHISRQIASAIDYCHRNSIVHRDLKVENILISSNGDIKVIDFGLSNVFSPNSQLTTFCGSLYFAAPELLGGRFYTGPEVDVWSFGVVIYILVCGQVPFDDTTIHGMHLKVRQGNVNYPMHLSSDCKNLLQRMLVVSSRQRATMSEVIAHDWMNKGYDAPIDNHLPKRKPLRSPIDMKVVRGMQGFEFGTEEEIKTELESIITSSEYEEAAAELEHLSLQPYNVHVSHPLLRRKSFSLAMTDPQSMPAAYHPLISIYYLVKERMEREAAEFRHVTAPPTPPPVDEPVIGIAYTPEGRTDVHNPTQQEQDMMIRQMMANNNTFGPSPRNSSDLAPATAEPSTGEKKESVFRRIGRRLSRQHVHDTLPVSASKTDERQNPTVFLQVNEAPAGHHHHKNSKHKRSVSITAQELSSTRDKFDGPKGRRQSAAMHHYDRIVEVVDDPLSPSLTTSTVSSEQEGQADDKVKSVYVRGLFSVSTTSSKKVSGIRLEILRVLDEQKIKHQESRGRFECNVTYRTGSGVFKVEFDIYIVKIPWLLGMRGVQFRRLNGDPWVYKNTCSQILEDLKL